MERETRRDKEVAELQRRVAATEEVVFFLSVRLAEHDERLGYPQKPTAGVRWRSTKQVAGETGYSPSFVLKLVEQHPVWKMQIGGRVLVDAEAIGAHLRDPARRRRKVV
jgi:hypothetical protein